VHDFAVIVHRGDFGISVAKHCSMFQDTASQTHHDQFPPTHTTMLPKPLVKKRGKRKEVNYRAANRKGTTRKQEEIRQLLATGLPFSVKAVGVALGISRQLALYHVKKMAATGQLVMVLEPCERNGGLQFKVWSEDALMASYVTKFYTRRAA